MADPRFFMNRGPFTVAEIAAVEGVEPVANAANSIQLRDVAPLDKAEAQDVSFFDNPKYLEQFKASKAAACFVRPKYAPFAPEGMVTLITNDPYRAYALTAQKFYPREHAASGIHPSAIIAPTARVAKTASIAAGAVIEAKAEIGEHVTIGANAVIGEAVSIGDHTSIGPLSSISHSLIGSHCIIHRGVHIGQDGFGFALGRAGHEKVPQLGRVIIGNGVEIGSCTTIDRGAGPDTVIGDGSKIDNLVQIGHNVTLGKGVVIAAQSGVSGSSHVGDGVVMGGQCGTAGHLNIGSGVKIAGKSGVMSDIPAGSSYGGFPAVPIKDWHRQSVTVAQLAKKRRGAND